MINRRNFLTTSAAVGTALALPSVGQAARITAVQKQHYLRFYDALVTDVVNSNGIYYPHVEVETAVVLGQQNLYTTYNASGNRQRKDFRRPHFVDLTGKVHCLFLVGNVLRVGMRFYDTPRRRELDQAAEEHVLRPISQGIFFCDKFGTRICDLKFTEFQFLPISEATVYDPKNAITESPSK